METLDLFQTDKSRLKIFWNNDDFFCCMRSLILNPMLLSKAFHLCVYNNKNSSLRFRDKVTCGDVLFNYYPFPWGRVTCGDNLFNYSPFPWDWVTYGDVLFNNSPFPCDWLYICGCFIMISFFAKKPLINHLLVFYYLTRPSHAKHSYCVCHILFLASDTPPPPH